MLTCYADIEVDLFEHKEDILNKLSTKELIDEIYKRSDEGFDSYNFNESDSFYKSFSVDISDFKDDILAELDDSEILDEVRDRELELELEECGYISREELTSRLGLRSWATNEQIIEEIKNLH